MNLKTKSLMADHLLKDYFSDSYHFSDMMNATIFDGKQIIHPDNVSDYDTSTSTYYDDNDESVTIGRDRDVMKKITMNQSSILIGIENQGKEQYDMLFRALEYNMLTQSRQWHQIKTTKELRQNPPIQSISLILYYGENGWKGPRTYDEALAKPPVEFEDLTRHHMFPVVDIVSLDYRKFKNQDNRDMVKGLQMLYLWKGNISVFEGVIMSKIVALIIASHAKDRELLNIINYQKEEKIDMCESMRLYRERVFAEGKDEGKVEGRDEGRIEGEVNTLLDLLKLKLGKLSPKVEIEIERSNKEQLTQLKINIFSIEKEKDIEKILGNVDEHDISNTNNYEEIATYE